MQTLSEYDWNFNSVPDKELVPCLLWEYARESAFIRDVRQQCIQSWRAGGNRDERLTADLNKLHSIGPGVEVLVRGFYFAPDDPHRIDLQRDAYVTNSFPAPWQSLPSNERDFRLRALINAGWTPGVPFERADWHDVKDISTRAEACWRKIISKYHRVQNENPDAREVSLVEQGKLQPFTGIPVSILREAGCGVTAGLLHAIPFAHSYWKCWKK